MAEQISDGLPPLREVIAQHQLSAKKSFGQNFLFDLNLTRKIARQIPDIKNTHVLEIGPGPGGLTRALLMEGAKSVTVIEKDERCIPVLDEINTAYPSKLKAHFADALTLNHSELFNGIKEPIHICANLPYNVGTALLVKWLSGQTWPPFFNGLTLMFQKEVAQRITAQENTKAYGRLTVLSNWRAKTKILFDIPPSAFTPAPKIISTVVQITPKQPCIDSLDIKSLELLTEAAFGQRRKMLRASLKKLSIGQEQLSAIGLNGTERPEQLDIATICKLAKEFQEIA